MGILNKILYKKSTVIAIWISAAGIVTFYNLLGIKVTDYVPQCWFEITTGLLSPGCGGTRSVHYLLTGDIARSLRLHFVPVTGFIYFALLLTEHSINTFLGTRSAIFLPKAWILYIFAAELILYTIIRNIL